MRQLAVGVLTCLVCCCFGFSHENEQFQCPKLLPSLPSTADELQALGDKTKNKKKTNLTSKAFKLVSEYIRTPMKLKHIVGSHRFFLLVCGRLSAAPSCSARTVVTCRSS